MHVGSPSDLDAHVQHVFERHISKDTLNLPRTSPKLFRSSTTRSQTHRHSYRESIRRHVSFILPITYPLTISRSRHIVLFHPLRLSRLLISLTLQNQTAQHPHQKLLSPAPHPPLRPFPTPRTLRRFPPRRNQLRLPTNPRRPCSTLLTINLPRPTSRPPSNLLDPRRPQQTRRPTRHHLRRASHGMHRPPRRRRRHTPRLPRQPAAHHRESRQLH